MVLDNEGERPVQVVFTGTRREMAGILLRGYALMLPTIGLYRFWVTSWKRRFYWSNTEIDGDPLDYTGHALQLLIGFMLALIVFVPIYALFFYLSTQSGEVAVTGYGIVAVVLWFLTGYAGYRARDFRLSRTLWRGIRFDQAGNAFGYAFRRFGWTILMLLTLGIVYPWMSSNLWRYRWNNTWYGDRQFSFTGRARALLGPYYLAYGVVVVVGSVGVLTSAGMGAFTPGGPSDPLSVIPGLVAALICGAFILIYQSREMTRFWSQVHLGTANLAVTVRARSLIGQYLLFGLALLGIYIVLAIGGIVVLFVLASDAFAGGEFDTALFMSHLQGSAGVLIAVVIGYLLILAAFSFMHELFIGLGFWKLVARNASISDVASLRSVRARGEDKTLAGEGLADALNVGAY
ncbi:MAG: hypothetical protein JWR51_2050 [Devosia sp.]|uniref:DUF898 family protein n=1 Tax=Devosia sp. TaxID=1871048 RepID=UPI00261FDEEA|nr:DUF898 family protein [Devosia sp.]MDB5528947.1 hypothetical protein [Devosia sp.]